MMISQRAFNMTVAEEVSSQAYYEKFYQHPEWPGSSSGVTVGIGYDLGQCASAKIQSDWSTLVSPDMLLTMMSCSGYTGSAGRNKLASVKNRILITWDDAMAVFAKRDVPQWTAAVLKAIPGADQLNGDLLGVLFDIAYNRGIGGFNSTNDRYREMKAIRYYVGANQLDKVPAEIQSMKRLWPNVSGLRARCDHRVTLWIYGMTQPAGPAGQTVAVVGLTPLTVDPEFPLEDGPARTKPAVVSDAQNSMTVAIAITGLAIATLQENWLWFLGAALLAVALWWVWYKYRNPAPADINAILKGDDWGRPKLPKF